MPLVVRSSLVASISADLPGVEPVHKWASTADSATGADLGRADGVKPGLDLFEFYEHS